MSASPPMSGPGSELFRVSLLLYVRGFLVLALAAVAVRWPEETLLSTMTTAGVIVAALGFLELAIATFGRSGRQTKTLLLLHAMLSIAFGAVAVSLRLASARTAITLTAVWLLLHAALALALAGRIPAVRHGRAVLSAWSAMNLLCAFLVVAAPWMTVPTLIYLGAAYTTAYGTLQIAAALWIRRELRSASVLGKLASR